MLQAMWRPEARIEVADFHVEVGDFHWPHPVETHTCVQGPQLSLSLTPPPLHSQVRYEFGGARDRYADVGDLIFFPGAVPFSGRSDGGRQRLLMCRFGRERLAPLRHNDSAWSETELNSGLDNLFVLHSRWKDVYGLGDDGRVDCTKPAECSSDVRGRRR